MIPMRILTRMLFSVARVSGGVATLLHYAGASTLRLADMKQGIQQTWQRFNDGEEGISAGLMPWRKISFAGSSRRRPPC